MPMEMGCLIVVFIGREVNLYNPWSLVASLKIFSIVIITFIIIIIIIIF